MIRGEGAVLIPGVSAQEVFDFVLDPAQYTRADTKMVWVTKLADTADGMLAREDGLFLGRFRGSVITRYTWREPHRIDVRLVHGMPSQLHAWFDIEARAGGTWLHHVETMAMRQPLGLLYDAGAGRWFARAVEREVAEIRRLMVMGERGRGPAAHDAA